MTSNVLLFRIPYVLINASRFLVANQMGTLRRVTVDYTSSLATFWFHLSRTRYATTSCLRKWQLPGYYRDLTGYAYFSITYGAGFSETLSTP